MKNKKVYQELNYLRVILCIMIITTHTLTEYVITQRIDDYQMETIYWIRMALIIGTAGFIILSQLLVTMNYRQLPQSYLPARLQYILIPYLVMGLIYSYSESRVSDIPFTSQFIQNVILGNWYGYFILVIIQFSLLNRLIYSLHPQLFSSAKVVIIFIVINLLYLYSYEHFSDFTTFVDRHYPFSQNTFILGWIGYYFFGSYIGQNYNTILNMLSDHIAILIIITVFSYLFFILIAPHQYTEVSSYQFSILPYTLCSFLLLLKFSTIFNRFMYDIVVEISVFSFFIYLLHPIILKAIYTYTERYNNQTFIFIPLTCLIVVGCCIGIGHILRQFSIFKYLMGKQPYRN